MPVEISVAQKEGKLKDDDPPEPASSTLQGLEETIGNLSIKDVAAPYAKPNCTVVDASSDSAEESSDDDNNAASSSAKTKPKQADTTSEESAGEEEEQEIKSVLETGEDNPADNYVAKGPMRRIEAKAHNGNPYQKPQQHQQPQQPQQQLQDLGECLSNDLGGKGGSCSGDLDLVSMGQFLDEIYPELNLDQISLGGPMGIPGKYLHNQSIAL